MLWWWSRWKHFARTSTKICICFLFTLLIFSGFVYGCSWAVAQPPQTKEKDQAAVLAATISASKFTDAAAIEAFLALPQVCAVVLTDFAALAAARNLPSTHVPRFVLLTNTPFTAENGMLTPSLKICRHKIRSTYLPALRRIYQSTDPVAHKVNAVIRALTREINSATRGADRDQKPVGAGADTSEIDVSLSLPELGLSSVETIRLISAVREQLHAELPLGM